MEQCAIYMPYKQFIRSRAPWVRPGQDHSSSVLRQRTWMELQCWRIFWPLNWSKFVQFCPIAPSSNTNSHWKGCRVSEPKPAGGISSTPTIWPLTFGQLEVHFFPWTLLAASILYVEYFDSAVVSLLWRMDLDSANTQSFKIKGLCFNEDLCIFYFWNDKTTNKHASEEAAACVWIFSTTLIAATNWFLPSEEPICKNHPITGQEHRRD